MGNAALKLVEPYAGDSTEAVVRSVRSEERKRQHAAELAQMALEAGDTEWAEALLSDAKKAGSSGGRERRKALLVALAPWVGGAAALAVTLTRANEHFFSLEHNARVAFMLAAPWLARAAVKHSL